MHSRKRCLNPLSSTCLLLMGGPSGPKPWPIISGGGGTLQKGSGGPLKNPLGGPKPPPGPYPPL